MQLPVSAPDDHVINVSWYSQGNESPKTTTISIGMIDIIEYMIYMMSMASVTEYLPLVGAPADHVINVSGYSLNPPHSISASRRYHRRASVTEYHRDDSLFTQL